MPSLVESNKVYVLQPYGSKISNRRPLFSKTSFSKLIEIDLVLSISPEYQVN